MRKRRLTKVRYPAQGHLARKCWDLNPEDLILGWHCFPGDLEGVGGGGEAVRPLYWHSVYLAS